MRVWSAAPTAPGVSAQIQSFSLSQGLSRRRSNHSFPKAPKTCQPEALGCHFPGAREAGTGPELTPTRVGEGGGAAVPAAGAGRGPGTRLEKGRDHAMLAVTASQGAGCQGAASPPWDRGGSRDAERGSSVVQGQAEAAANTHSARTPGSPLPSPPYCSRPGRPRGRKPRDNLQETSRGGACMGA